jgi:hypothetical protein
VASGGPGAWWRLYVVSGAGWSGGVLAEGDDDVVAKGLELGMLRSSFVPPPEIRALRVYTRHIWDLTADRTSTGSGWRSCWRTPCAS